MIRDNLRSADFNRLLFSRYFYTGNCYQNRESDIKRFCNARRGNSGREVGGRGRKGSRRRKDRIELWQCANTSIFRLRTLIEPEQDVIVHYARFLINVPLLRSPFNLSVTLCTIFYFVTLFANIVSMNRKDREKNQNRVTRYCFE